MDIYGLCFQYDILSVKIVKVQFKILLVLRASQKVTFSTLRQLNLTLTILFRNVKRLFVRILIMVP